MSDRPETTQQPLPRQRLRKEIAAVLWLAGGLYLLLCLLSYHPLDPSFNNNLHPASVRNFGGCLAPIWPTCSTRVWACPPCCCR